MSCEHCSGDTPVFWKDDANCAFVNSGGEMMVVVNDKTIRFKVNRCPMCGRLFKGVNYLNLRHGDDIWYSDIENQRVEHGTIHAISIKDGKVDSFSVNFDNGDFDVFSGGALGVHYFIHEVDAADALTRPVEEFEGIGNIPSHNSLFVMDEIWYVDVDADIKNIEHGRVHHVGMTSGHIDWFSVKFDDGSDDEFGPTALGFCCFKSLIEAEKAWSEKHE